jgi:hypothetical protein
VNQVDAFTWGTGGSAVTVGGPAPTYPTEILSQFYLNTTQDDAEFVARFAVRVASPSTPVADYNALNAACQALELALRTRYQRLEIDWGVGANPVEVFDPNVSAGSFPSSGFDQEPLLRKLREDEFPNSGEARGYEFRVKLAQYPTYTDTYGFAAGRRQADLVLRYDANGRLGAVLSGEWTQVPGALGRNQFISQVEAYAQYRLSLLANAGPLGGLVSVAGSSVTGTGTSFTKLLPGTIVWFGTQPGVAYTVASVASDTALTLSGGYSGPTATNTAMLVGQWTLVRRDEGDPNSLSTLRFTREYRQHVFGRELSTVEVAFGPSRQRFVTIRGSYLRTIPGGGGTYGNQYGTANGSLANFGDATNGGRAYAETSMTGQLATLTAAQGDPLTYGSDCELVGEPLVETNETDDRTVYTLVYRELLQKQSNQANVLDDPNIVQDSMAFAAVFHEANDSTSAPLAAAIPGPGGASSAPGSSASSGNMTTERIQGGPSSTSGAGVTITKPVDLFVHYEAFFTTDVTDLYSYWTGQVEPLLIQLFETLFGYNGVEFVERAFRPDPTSNKVSADVHLRAYGGNVILFTFTLGLFNDTGVRVDPAFNGTPHAYLVQQALPKATMSRRVEAVSRSGPNVDAFSLEAFRSPSTLGPGWVKLMDATPSTVTRTLGIPGLNVPQTTLTYAVLEENFVWVAVNVGQGGGSTTTGGGGSNPTPTGIPMTFSPPPTTTTPATATGSG